MTQCRNSRGKFTFRKKTSDPYFSPFTVVSFPLSLKRFLLLFKQRALFPHFLHKNSKQKICPLHFTSLYAVYENP